MNLKHLSQREREGPSEAGRVRGYGAARMSAMACNRETPHPPTRVRARGPLLSLWERCSDDHRRAHRLRLRQPALGGKGSGQGGRVAGPSPDRGRDQRSRRHRPGRRHRSSRRRGVRRLHGRSEGAPGRDRGDDASRRAWRDVPRRLRRHAASADRGREFGVTDGLGWIGGEVRLLEPATAGLKVPHMGWNSLDGSLASRSSGAWRAATTCTSRTPMP